MKNSKKVYYTQQIIWISTIALLFCPCPSLADGQNLWESDGVGLSAPNTYPPQVISDGNGGAIIVGTYTYDLNPTTYYADVLAFRIDYTGTISWSRNFGTSAHAPAVTSNGSGGAIIAWLDGKQDSNGYKILAQSLDASGNLLWNSGNPVQVSSSFGGFSSVGAYMYPKICLDGTGGAFIDWKARLAYINSTGTLPSPGIDGIELIPNPTMESSFEMISDGTGGPCFIPGTGWTMCPGGVYAAWNDTTTAALTVQRVKTGKMWGAAGTPISSTSGISYNLSIDGTSGFLISWLESAVNPKLRAQKNDTNGNSQWTAGGVIVVDSAVIGGVISELSMTTDSSSGAIIAWIDHRNADRDAYAQRLNASGLPQWTANGVLLPPYIVGQTAPGEQASIRIVSDTIGGAVVTYQDQGGWSWDISATRLNQSGTKLWSNFIYMDCYYYNPPCYDQVLPAIVFDASGPDYKGAIIAWRSSLAAQKVMVDTSLDSDGDGYNDTEDNCPNKPNGPTLGTCNPASGNAGIVCTSDAQCTSGCASNGHCDMNQEDIENDGVGDVCDNCVNKCNSQQLDADSDGRGDVCDSTPGCGGCTGIACEQQC
jgi:hypothetical protein